MGSVIATREGYEISPSQIAANIYGGYPSPHRAASTAAANAATGALVAAEQVEIESTINARQNL